MPPPGEDRIAGQSPCVGRHGLQEGMRTRPKRLAEMPSARWVPPSPQDTDKSGRIQIPPRGRKTDFVAYENVSGTLRLPLGGGTPTMPRMVPGAGYMTTYTACCAETGRLGNSGKATATAASDCFA